MAKIMTVKEALAMMQAKENKKGEKIINRFNKKNFNILMTAIANDLTFSEKVAKKVGDSFDLEEVLVTKGFRKWCKKLVEKAGVDKSESEIVMSPDFKIDDCEELYDFFAAALYEYMDAGNKFDLPGKEDFQGSFYIKDVAEATREYDARNPLTNENIGKFKSTTKKHKEAKAKSTAPDWLTTKKKL
jgi:hypothetical protein